MLGVKDKSESERHGDRGKKIAVLFGSFEECHVSVEEKKD